MNYIPYKTRAPQEHQENVFFAMHITNILEYMICNVEGE